MLSRYTNKQREKCSQLNRQKGKLENDRKKICLHAGCNCKTEVLTHAKIQASSLSEWSQVNYST